MKFIRINDIIINLEAVRNISVDKYSKKSTIYFHFQNTNDVTRIEISTEKIASILDQIMVLVKGN